MKTESIKRFVTHYAWAGTIIGFAVGLLFGPGTLWKYFEFRQKSQSAEIEQIRLEKELYERLQVLQNQISSAILQYIPLRDRYVSLMNEGPSQKKYEVQNEYNAATATLESLTREYNRIETRLSNMEGRSPRVLVITVPPPAVSNLRIE
jgi:hypothetical protein